MPLTLLKRSNKGSALTFEEMDNNLSLIESEINSKASSSNPIFTGTFFVGSTIDDGSGAKLQVNGNVSAATFIGELDWSNVTNKPELVDKDEVRSFGLRTNTALDTDEFITQLESWGMFDSTHSFCKFTWNYSGNTDLYLDSTLGTIETAGAVVETYTDNSNDITRGNIHIRLICPNAGVGSPFREFIYNDQGPTYYPGWREVWNSKTLTNLSQLTNGPGYITSSGNAATATKLATARTINGISFDGTANISTTEYIHSARDLNGVIITTNISYANSSGDPWVLEIKGNSYASYIPFDIQYQGYIYSDTIINHGGYSNGTNITGLVALNVGGNLTFWFPKQAYWQGFNVKVYTANATSAINKVTSITGGAKPAGTKEVALSGITQSLHTGNYTSYVPAINGTGATGTWPINITGTSPSVSGSVGSLTGEVSAPYGSITITGTKGAYSGIYLSSSSNTVASMFDTAGNGGNYDTTTGWHYYWNRTNACLGIGGSATSTGYKAQVNGNLRTVGQIVSTGDILSGGNIRAESDYGTGLIGKYLSDKYQQIYAMGYAYRMKTDGTSLTNESGGNFYGIAWTHDNAGGQAKVGLGHQALFCQNAVAYTAIGNGIWTLGKITAPNLFDSYCANAGSSGAQASIACVGEGRGVVLGYSGGDYSGIGYNIRHTATSGSFILPGADTASYLKFNNGGFSFRGASTGTAGRSSTLSVLATLDVSGNFTATANITAYSDETLKEDWKSVKDTFIEDLAKVKAGDFLRKDINQRQVGVSAQDMEKILPNSIKRDEKDLLTLAYGNAAMVSAVELAKEIIKLKTRIEELENR